MASVSLIVEAAAPSPVPSGMMADPAAAALEPESAEGGARKEEDEEEVESASYTFVDTLLLRELQEDEEELVWGAGTTRAGSAARTLAARAVLVAILVLAHRRATVRHAASASPGQFGG